MKAKLTKILVVLAIALVTITSRADTIAIPVAANVVSNLFTNGKQISQIIATATSTNITTFKFYDSSNTSTTIVQAAYQNWASYATNFSTTFTNESGVLITNSFSGIWTYPTSVSASTNARPVVLTLVVPAGAQRTKVINLLTIHGLNVIPNQSGIVEVDYRR